MSAPASSARRLDKIESLRTLIPLVEVELRDFPVVFEDRLTSTQGAKFDFSSGAYVMQLAGVRGTATQSRAAAVHAWLRAARKRLAVWGAPS